MTRSVAYWAISAVSIRSHPGGREMLYFAHVWVVCKPLTARHNTTQVPSNTALLPRPDSRRLPTARANLRRQPLTTQRSRSYHQRPVEVPQA